MECNTKISEIKKKITDHDHDKYKTTQTFNKLTPETFAARLAPANLAGKNDVAALVKKKRKDFDDELKNFNKEVTQINQNVYLLKMNQKMCRQ